jgi:glycosyltransferase involved in cell wall biosynthesis
MMNKNRGLNVAIMMPALVRGQMGGTEVYAEELVSHLERIKDTSDKFIIVYAGKPDAGSGGVLLQQRSSFITEHVLANFQTGMSRYNKLLTWLKLVFQKRSIWQEIETAAAGQIDVVMYPFTAMLPKPRKYMKTVTIVHDLQHLDLPNSFDIGQRIYRNWTYDRPMRRTDAVIAVSEFTKNRVIELLKVPPQKVHRIYPGIRSKFELNERVKRNATPVSSQFLYYPARGLPHKNHGRLFEAFEEVRKTHPELVLRLSGSDQERLPTLPQNVEHMGNLNWQEILWHYRNSRAVIFPSTYEGFGFPVLEALAVGAPLVASDIGPISEITSDLATLIDPWDVKSIKEGILQILDSPVLLGTHTDWTTKFNWENSLVEILAVLKSVNAAPLIERATTSRQH